MALIKFGDEYFCFGIYLSNIFFVKTFRTFFFKILFPTLFFQIFFSNILKKKNFSQNFFFNCFSTFLFEDFTLDASPFTQTKQTMYLCYEKYKQAVEIGR